MSGKKQTSKMALKKLSEDVTYTRHIPDIFGVKNVYDLVNLQNQKGETNYRFIAQVFSGLMLINKENTISFNPTKKSSTVQALSKNNDEIQLVSQFPDSTVDMENISGVTIPLMRPGFDIYGHWLLDLLPKLSVFEELNPGVNYSILVDKRCPEWAINLITELYSNFTAIKKIDPGKPILGEFFFMSPIRRHDYLSEKCKISTFTTYMAAAPKRKIYISRKHLNLNHRQLENSDRIEKLFSRKGFELVYPEELTVKEQRHLFSETSILAGEAGSGLHNSIFCSKDTVVINIQSGRQNHFIQAGLCQQYGQGIIYVSGKTKTNDWGSSFKASKRDCKQAIKRAMSL